MRFIRMMKWETKGLGTKKWAGNPRPFFCLQESKRPAHGGPFGSYTGAINAPGAAACLLRHPILLHPAGILSSR